MGKKKNPLPFDRRGGRIVVQRRLLESDAYLELSAQAKVLMSLMQIHWRPDKPVAYGVREAQQKIPCAKVTAQKAFSELVEAGFIVKVDESLFIDRTQSKSRTWRLTWLPWTNKPPTNNWEKNRCTGSDMAPVETPQG